MAPPDCAFTCLRGSAFGGRYNVAEAKHTCAASMTPHESRLRQAYAHCAMQATVQFLAAQCMALPIQHTAAATLRNAQVHDACMLTLSSAFALPALAATGLAALGGSALTLGASSTPFFSSSCPSSELMRSEAHLDALAAADLKGRAAATPPLLGQVPSGAVKEWDCRARWMQAQGSDKGELALCNRLNDTCFLSCCGCRAEYACISRTHRLQQRQGCRQDIYRPPHPLRVCDANKCGLD
jgi:hypothetical protein